MKYVHAGARLSQCGTYRYVLTRRWEDRKEGTPDTVVFLMLNPSTADADLDDPTVRRCVGFGRQFGFRRLVVVNLFAYRATDPNELRRASDPVGPDNDEVIQEICAGRDVVCAWGTFASSNGMKSVLRDRPRQVMRIVSSVGGRLHCLGKTAGGWPRHPVRLAGDVKMETFG